MNLKQAKKIVQQQWEFQGFNAYPIFLNPSGFSGFTMKKVLGYAYETIVCSYQRGYGEFGYYLKKDLARMWKIIKSNLTKDPRYLAKIRAIHHRNYRKFFKRLAVLDIGRLSKLSDQQLVDLLKQAAFGQMDSVGPAHIIEPISYSADQELDDILAKKVPNKIKARTFYNILTAPTRLSFIAQEERDLLKIARLPAKARKAALRRHAIKYHWIQNSYAGSRKLTPAFFKKQLSLIKNAAKKSKRSPNKVSLIRKLKLSGQAKQLIKIIDFATYWQDERKAFILQAIYYLDKVVKEISRRTNLPLIKLYYLGVNDLLSIKSLQDIIDLNKELGLRLTKSFFLMHRGREYCFTGQAYDKLFSWQHHADKVRHSTVDLHGAIANQGTASGRAVICKGLASFKKVKAGDVIVASMTRPEFMPILKKAAAIVTDEGGVTCHAAIVSRELGIPCVIGTKIATRTIKEGDLVEVRANHGYVKIIK